MTSCLPQELRRAGTATAEMEIGADHNRRSAKSIDEIGADEGFRLDRREGTRKRQYGDAGKPERRGEPGLLLAIAQAEQEGLGREDVARMRFEGQKN